MSPALFGIRNPVPVNLIMIAILVAGLVSGLGLRREFFPESDPDRVSLSMPFPGATPDEVEDGLAIKVENQLVDLNEVDEITTALAEGGGGVTIKLVEGVDPQEALDEIERSIDALRDLPDEAEEITAQLIKPRLPVIRVAVFGPLDEAVMKDLIRGVRDDLQSFDGMGEVLIDGVRDYEISVEVRSAALIEHGLSLPAVATTVHDWMSETPGGMVRGRAGNVRVRTMGVPERADAVRNIVLRSDAAGRALTVADVAHVTAGFVEDRVINRFNREPAAVLTVFKVGDQDIVDMAKKVRRYVAGRQGKEYDGPWWGGAGQREAWELGRNSPTPLPVGASIDALSDLARFVEGRLDLLIRNASFGGVLVFATLLLFLNWRVALWVGVGLGLALLGTLVLMSALDVTLNLLTMFGLIVVMGLLVDDAIVVSENIQARHDRGEPALEAAVSGTGQVGWPVVATVMTSVVAFAPLSFIKGHIGDLLGALPVVVGCALVMSLLESLFILPAHLGHSLLKRDVARERLKKTKGGPSKMAQAVERFEATRDHWVMGRLVPGYVRLLSVALRARYVTLAATLAAFIVVVGLFKGGRVGFTFLPNNDSETVVVDLRMPIGTPLEATERVVKRIENAAFAESEIRSVGSVVGQRANVDSGQSEAAATHVAQMFIELFYVEERERESSKVVASIRENLAGQLNDIDRIGFSEISGGPGGAGITLRVRGADSHAIEAAVRDIKHELNVLEGVVDVADDNDLGQAERQIVPRPADAAAVGLTPLDIAGQVRATLFGIDAHTFSDRQEDVDVRVRMDTAMRRDLGAVENMWLMTPAGRAVPLSQVADIKAATTYATIKRVDRQRSVTVTADTVPSVSPEDISNALDERLDAIRADHPRVKIAYAGRQEQMGDAFASLPMGMLAACLMIYVILAWLFGSYVQPLVVMAVIPFSLIGVVLGHMALGYDLTFLSLIGMVALAGIVVNDSLILIEFFNLRRSEGREPFDALLDAGRDRLRPILLTTITTVLGLMPLILEQSFQAKFLIPMGISIAMGLMSATFLILLTLPCLVLMLDDVKHLAKRAWG